MPAAGDPQLFCCGGVYLAARPAGLADQASVAGALLGGPDQGPLPVHVFKNSLGVYDALSSPCETGSKEVRAVAGDLRNFYTSGALATITWIPWQFQLANGLTEATGAINLRAAIGVGRLSLLCPTSKLKRADDEPSEDKPTDGKPAEDETADDKPPPNLSGLLPTALAEPVKVRMECG